MIPRDGRVFKIDIAAQIKINEIAIGLICMYTVYLLQAKTLFGEKHTVSGLIYLNAHFYIKSNCSNSGHVPKRDQ